MDFKVGDAVIRHWNKQLYFICHDVDGDKQEFLISKNKGEKVSKCKVCEHVSNLTLATPKEIEQGYRD